MPDFETKVQSCITAFSSKILLISPIIDHMPPDVQRYDEPLLPFAKFVIQNTRDLVAGYMFDLPRYMALGAVGMIALERSIDYVGDAHITILDGRFAHPDFAIVMDENAFGVDAVTLAAGTDIKPFLKRADRGAFAIVDAVSADDLHSFDGLTFRLHSQARLTLAGTDVLYAGRGGNFVADLRAALAT